MKQFMSLLWKEWYEVRALFVIALFVFLGLPLIGGLEEYYKLGYFHLSASVWIFYLGGLLSIFIGVGTVARDFGGGLEDFWRSRPLGIGRWLLVKYSVGLIATLVPLCIPLLLQHWVNRIESELVIEPRFILAWCPFLWAMLYSIGFLSACLLRRAAHAAMLAVALGLLVYFLPEVVPPLRFLSLGRAIDDSHFPRADRAGRILPIYHHLPWTPGNVPFEPRQLQFVFGMLGLCVIGVLISLVVVRRDWRIESSRKLVYWSIGGALLVLFSSAAFRVESNLTLLQTVDLPRDTHEGFIVSDGTQGVMIGQRWVGHYTHAVIRSLRPSPSGIEFDPPVEIERSMWRPVRWRPQYPNVLYNIKSGPERTSSEENYPVLITVTLRGGAADVSVQEFPQFAVSNRSNEFHWWGAYSIIYQDRLYLLGSKLLIFDLADASNPRLISAEPVDRNYFHRTPEEWSLLEGRGDVDGGTVSLPPVPQLPPRQRLELAARDWAPSRLSGDILVRAFDDHLTTYHLDQFNDNWATFRKLGLYDPTPLERLFGSSVWESALAGNLLFESTGASQGRWGGAHIAVFDISGPRPYPVGHFALPNEQDLRALCPLPDGRLLAMGAHKLYLLGAPPGRK